MKQSLNPLNLLPGKKKLSLTIIIFLSALLMAPESFLFAQNASSPNTPKKSSVNKKSSGQKVTPEQRELRRKRRAKRRRAARRRAAQKAQEAKQIERPAPKAAAKEKEQVVQNTSEDRSGKAVLENSRRQVSVRKKGSEKWIPLKDKGVILTDDTIQTGRRSLARVQLEDGSKVLLLQNSEVEMENLSNVKKAIRLLRGRVRAIVSKIQNREFRIQTPIGVASVRGTEFEVEFSDDSQEMEVEVLEGQVGVTKLGDLAEEVILNRGQSIRFTAEGLIGDPVQTGMVPINRSEVRNEVMITSVKEGILAQAAEDLRSADFQTGKSLIDVDGSRVRVEQYIMRPAANQFKLVSLNERANRFDWFSYLGTVNTTLPDDLSVALGQIKGKFGTTAPDYYLTGYEMEMSNTIDSITETGAGGHLVKIEFDGTNYTLTDNDDAGNTRTIAAAELQGDSSYKVYNPVSDKYSLVSAANLTEALKISVLDAGDYRNLTSGDTLWKTRFNSLDFRVNGTVKTAWAKSGSANTLAIDLDASFTSKPLTSVSEYPMGTDRVNQKITLYYSNGSTLTYDNYIIDDEGEVAQTSLFNGVSSSADYQEKLLNFNYQQKITATEMGGREINLVIDPKIGTISGLIQ